MYIFTNICIFCHINNVQQIMTDYVLRQNGMLNGYIRAMSIQWMIKWTCNDDEIRFWTIFFIGFNVKTMSTMVVSSDTIRSKVAKQFYRIFNHFLQRSYVKTITTDGFVVVYYQERESTKDHPKKVCSNWPSCFRGEYFNDFLLNVLF